MSLIFIDGQDVEDFLIKWACSDTSAPTFVTGRYGTGRAVRPAAATITAQRAFTAASDVIFGAALLITTINAERYIWAFKGDSGATTHLTLRVTAAGALAVYRSTTQIATTAAGVIAANVWNYIEMRATINDSTGVCQVKVNGTQLINFSGDTKNAGTNTTIDAIDLQSGGQGVGIMTYDDMYCLNNSGSAPNNTFLGEVIVQTSFPSGAGNSTQFTPVGSGSNYANVDETPYSTTDYNADATVGHKDLYAMQDLSAATTTVYGVQANIIAAKSDAAAANVRTVVRSGGTDYTDATQSLSATAKTYSVLRETDPATSAAWTASGVNAAEFGVEVV